jgi:hypothetical protein
MKRKGFSPQLDPQQQLILALVLIVLVAVSLLYCLGFASVLLRKAWENAPLPWNEANPTSEILDLSPLPEIEPMVTEVAPY